MLKNIIKNFFNKKSIDADKWNDIEEKLFDEDFYKKTYQDLKHIQNYFKHYKTFGWREGRDPNEWFSTKDYLNTYSDVKNSGLDPFYHYIRYGLTEGRKTFARNNSESINKPKKDLTEACNTPAESNNSIISGNNNEPIPKEIMQLVDPIFYRQSYKDLANEHQCGLHYCIFGWKEHRDPNKNFSTEMFFLENNIDSDTIESIIDAVNNPNKYIITSSRLGDTALDISICGREVDVCRPYVDAAYYAEQYGILENQVEHFCTIGYKKNYNPNSWFDTLEYIKHKTSLYNGGVNPLYHYLKKGVKEYSIYSNKIVNYKGAKFDLYKAVPLAVSPTIAGLVQYTKRHFNSSEQIYTKKEYDADHLHLHWIIPDFGQGGGGHLNIFRTVRFLEKQGFYCKIWIANPVIHKSEKSAYCDLIKYYPTVKADLVFLTDDQYPTDGDALIATGWQTVEWAKKIRSYQVLFYFVQDYEKLFYAKGSNYFLAEKTYTEDINCICASPWLERIMKEQYGRNTCSYKLGYNKTEFYEDHSIEKYSVLDNKKHIIVYSRIYTERRAVELSMIALHLVAQKRDDFIVHCIGGGVDLTAAPFDYVLHGVMSLEQLKDLYNACDFGVCFSATNYSLLPQEMMACGLPLLELDGENTRNVFAPDIIRFTKPDPLEIADNIEYMLDHANECRIMAEKAKKWVTNIPWDKSYSIVKNFISNTIDKEFTSKGIKPVHITNKEKEGKIIATVAIPVYNPDESFKYVLDKVCNQHTDWNYEVLLIDSSTKENQWCNDYCFLSDKIVYHRIDSKDFQHGKTRNLAVSLSKGDYVAFITQDALPYDENWLFNLVTVLSKYDDVAIAFGKHYPYKESDVFVKRDITECFKNLNNYPLILGKNTDPIKYSRKEEGWMQLLHFYSDNNSCLKKKYWEQVPMRDVDFGEDQLLALDMINAGYKKIYVPSAGVYHSHSFNADETYKRSCIEREFFAEFFGYKLIGNYDTPDHLEMDLNNIDKLYAQKNNISYKILEDRYKVNRAKARAYFGVPLEDNIQQNM